MNYWAKNHRIDDSQIEKEEAKMKVRDHFASICSNEAMKAFNKIFGL
jgi:hypothetical protein